MTSSEALSKAMERVNDLKERGLEFVPVDIKLFDTIIYTAESTILREIYPTLNCVEIPIFEAALSREGHLEAILAITAKHVESNTHALEKVKRLIDHYNSGGVLNIERFYFRKQNGNPTPSLYSDN